MKGYIYKISSLHTDLIYYGSTTLSLNERLRLHYSKYKRYINGKFNKIPLYDLLQYECKIELLEEHEVNNQKELLPYEKIIL